MPECMILEEFGPHSSQNILGKPHDALTPNLLLPTLYFLPYGPEKIAIFRFALVIGVGSMWVIFTST